MTAMEGAALPLGAISRRPSPAVAWYPTCRTAGPIVELSRSASSAASCCRAAGVGATLVQGDAWLLPARLAGVMLTATAVTKAKKAPTGRKRSVYPGIVSPMRFVPPHIKRPPYIGPGQSTHPSEGFPKHDFIEKAEVKNAEQIARMRESCALAREALELAGRLVAPGVTTDEIDAAVFNFCVERGAYPSPLLYCGYPKNICTSVNDIVAHGIPDNRPLEDGDIVNIDVTLYYNGYHGDTSSMFIAGRPTRSAYELCKASHEAMWAGINVCGPGVDFREVGKAIGAVTDAHGLKGCEVFRGHGIGSYFHGAPEVVPVVNDEDRGIMLPGMTFTIEPILLEGFEQEEDYKFWEDCWTLQTKSGALTAQFEHTLLITESGRDVLTGPSIDYRALAKQGLKANEDKIRPPARSKPKQGAVRSGFA